MEEKIKDLKEKLIQMKYEAYTDEFDDGDRIVGFLECARIFLSEKEVEECNAIAWRRYMEEEGYTAEQADEVYKETLKVLQEGIEYLRANPNAKLTDF